MKDLRFIMVHRGVLRNVNFYNCDLTLAKFVECDLRGACFKESILDNCLFIGSIITSTQVELSRSHLGCILAAEETPNISSWRTQLLANAVRPVVSAPDKRQAANCRPTLIL